MTKNRLYCGDNLEILATLEKESVNLIYIKGRKAQTRNNGNPAPPFWERER